LNKSYLWAVGDYCPEAAFLLDTKEYAFINIVIMKLNIYLAHPICLYIIICFLNGLKVCV